tara:strand:- start:607 stop:912 length:306 start_codon:yes stop_codon:yes gene_type:complete
MPDFGTKEVYFPSQRYRGELSEKESNNIVYIEFRSEVRAYDNIQYPSSYVNRVINEINAKGNPDNIVKIWQGNHCAWKHPDHTAHINEPRRPAPEEDDLPF